ncbi:hypothetical protein [Knoellia koreensis]|uniref:Uncharacterized protein n=1 Tax=Knoellia koreensis TaxID=2730921 RepID=A0A849HJ26_9MICO|nr:hypothetical protein [Knoellia sp. DB2414S]NNM46653.1 hypothetical protein [Knoellia sp. DB2414S]
MTPKSPVPQEVSTELERVVRRWQQLPLDRALTHVPVVRGLVEELAAHTAPAAGPVPDLGPATLMDQLRVLVFDACAAGRADDLGGRLADLRRTLA